ncbi:MAG: hypothetical protein SNJ64_05705 [Endomicrobiia bacterium]
MLPEKVVIYLLARLHSVNNYGECTFPEKDKYERILVIDTNSQDSADLFKLVKDKLEQLCLKTT